MRSFRWMAAGVLLLCSCIGWNEEQQGVVDSYMELRRTVADRKWNESYEMLTEGTREYIDIVLDIFQENNIELIDSRDDLFESLAIETEIFSMSDVIHSVEFAGDRALLTADGQDGYRTFEFLKEHGEWKLNLVPDIQMILNFMMEGTPESSGEAIPSYISSGEGSCIFLIRNNLNGLAIHNVFCSLSTDDSWGDDKLGPGILGTGSELGLHLNPGNYNIQVFDSMERSYTLWQVELDENGILWEITEEDMDRQQ
ncbi:hypothetical protein CSA37_03000 [Candidatus Fermentibacteria bacterium]|nr:MAG: hypothetical protein CSA37_03000 [Candidatus Fermentibacteria bacterium]